MCAILLVNRAGAQSQSNELYFPETGHTVQGEFLAAYQSVPAPRLLYGLPITDAFLDTTIGQQVQYFERARFELAPQSPGVWSVELAHLGRKLYQPDQSRPLPAAAQRLQSACRLVAGPDGEQPVCFAFLRFFEQHGGLKQFGAPISGLLLERGRIVQYFEKTRLEWRPELPAGQRVQLADLGRDFLALRTHEWPHYLPENRPQQVLELKVLAQAERPVTAMQDQQTMIFLVTDQNQRPVQGARLEINVRLPDGSQMAYTLPETSNAEGAARFTFSFETAIPGTVLVESSASYAALKSNSTSTFRAWF